MAWGRLDDRANGNLKLLVLSDAAHRMYTCGLIYCQAHLTDGFIPEKATRTFGVRGNRKLAIDQLCAKLVPKKGPLWHRTKGGFRVHDYLQWNDSKEKVLKQRLDGRARLARFRRRLKREGNALQTEVKQDSTPQPLPQSVSIDQKHSRGRVFAGDRLTVTQRQLDAIVTEMGHDAGYVDWMALFPEWDRQLVESGAPFHTLNFLRDQAAAVVKRLRAGGSLYQPTAEDEAARDAARVDRERQAEDARHRAEAVFAQLAPAEQAELVNEQSRYLASKYPTHSLTPEHAVESVILEICARLGGRPVDEEVALVRRRLKVSA